MKHRLLTLIDLLKIKLQNNYSGSTLLNQKAIDENSMAFYNGEKVDTGY